jgi:NADH:ubiquinone oxidoreductase subunit 3 (subunit A)
MFISSPFFILAVLFVLFDIELILIIPSIFNIALFNRILNLHLLLVIVLLTLLLE